MVGPGAKHPGCVAYIAKEPYIDDDNVRRKATHILELRTKKSKFTPIGFTSLEFGCMRIKQL